MDGRAYTWRLPAASGLQVQDRFKQFILHLVVHDFVDGWDPEEIHKNRFNDGVIMIMVIKGPSLTEILNLRESII